jgi:sensor domain CHASE-containing protein
MPSAGMGRVPATLGRQFGRVRSPASLGAKLVLIMTAVGLCGTAAIAVLLASIITPSFTKLENEVIAGHVDRTRVALSRYGARVEREAREYGAWTDGTDRDCKSVAPRALSDIGVQGIAQVAPDGRLVLACWRNAPGGVERPVARGQLIAASDPTNLARVLAGRRSARFFARIGNDVAAIGVTQIRGSDSLGVARGYGIMARVITSNQISQLLQRDATIDANTSLGGEITMQGASKLTIAVPMLGADGQAVASTRFSLPRDITLLGHRMLLLAVAGSTVLLLLVLIVLRRLIARLVLRPLHRHADTTRRRSAQRRDRLAWTKL